MRAALYTRVSTKDKGQETANQLTQLRDFCRSQNWDIVAEHEDHDSGSNPEPTQFRAMLADAMQRKFDVVRSDRRRSGQSEFSAPLWACGGAGPR